VLAGSARQSRVPGGEEYEVIQVGAGKTQGPPFTRERDPATTPEIFAALVAPAVSVGDEDLEAAPVNLMNGRLAESASTEQQSANNRSFMECRAGSPSADP
jgi:hypothetical protein